MHQTKYTTKRIQQEELDKASQRIREDGKTNQEKRVRKDGPEKQDVYCHIGVLMCGIIYEPI